MTAAERRSAESGAVIHTPCGHDWTDEGIHHVCRYTMDHDGRHVCRCGEPRITPPGSGDADVRE